MMYDMLRRASVLCPGDLSTICIIWMAYLRHLVRLRWISDAYISWPLSLRPLLSPAMRCVARRAPPPPLAPPLCALGGALGLTSVGWPYWAKQSHGSTAQPRSLSALAYLELQRLPTPPGPHLVQIASNSSSFLVVCCAPAWRFVGSIYIFSQPAPVAEQAQILCCISIKITPPSRRLIPSPILSSRARRVLISTLFSPRPGRRRGHVMTESTDPSTSHSRATHSQEAPRLPKHTR